MGHLRWASQTVLCNQKVRNMVAFKQIIVCKKNQYEELMR